MSLDFCLITKEGVPMEAAPIGSPQHRELISVARRSARMPLLLRMSDYHKDTVYEPAEVSSLAAELSWLIGNGNCPESVAETAMLMLSVCEYATTEGAGIEAIADDPEDV